MFLCLYQFKYVNFSSNKMALKTRCFLNDAFAQMFWWHTCTYGSRYTDEQHIQLLPQL